MNPARLARRSFARAGLALSVTDAGRGRVPFVFQHGLCGSAQQTAEACPDDDAIRLVTLECRGHGESPTGAFEQLSIATFADDLIALIDASAFAPVVLGGISMGAAIALRIAVLRPDLVRALVLVRPAWVLAAAPANMRPNAEVGELLQREPPARALATFEQGETARRLASESPDNLASLRGFFTRMPHDATAALLTRISADGPGLAEPQVRALSMPALVLGCALDAIHPLADAQRLATLIPNARFTEIAAKSLGREAYLSDLHAATAAFLHEVSA